MKIIKKKWIIIIVSDKLVTTISQLIGFSGKKGGKPAMGLALFPCFIILRNLSHPMTEQWINHESIHIRQFIESLGLFWAFSMLEYLYARLILKYSHVDAYYFEAVEMEAYLNQNNRDYLITKPLFSTLKYYFNKTKYHTDENYHVVIDSTETNPRY